MLQNIIIDNKCSPFEIALWICYQTLERTKAKEKSHCLSVYCTWMNCSVAYRMQTHKLLKSEWMGDENGGAHFTFEISESVEQQHVQQYMWNGSREQPAKPTKPIRIFDEPTISYFTVIITPFNMDFTFLPLALWIFLLCFYMDGQLKGNLFIFKMQFARFCYLYRYIFFPFEPQKDFSINKRGR